MENTTPKETGEVRKNRLRELRKKHCYTQEYLGQYLGVSRSLYALYEQGESDLPRDKQRMLAKLYGVRRSYMMDGREPDAFDLQFGFYKVACGVPTLHVGAPVENVREICALFDEALEENCSMLVLPELSLCGYTCADLFRHSVLLDACERALETLLLHTENTEMICIVGMPVRFGGALYDCALVLQDGDLLGVVPKEYLAEGAEFYEKRWFTSGANALQTSVTLAGRTAPFGRLLFATDWGLTFGVEICQDLWVPLPPSTLMALNGANLIVNLSASSEVVTKASYRESLVRAQSASLICAYAYCSAGVTESSTDLVFSGSSMICENGASLQTGVRFARESELAAACIDVRKLEALRLQDITFADNAARFARQDANEYRTVQVAQPPLPFRQYDGTVDPYPFVPRGKRLHDRCEEILQIQASGLATRMERTRSEKLIVGISGGLDSTLALLVAVRAVQLLGYPESNVLGVTMPGFGTTGRTYNNAMTLMKALGVSMREIRIDAACRQHMKDIGLPEDARDVTYENLQARERTQILMDLANRENRLLVGTGDLSELALGWCTYNGDHMSMYGVNASVPKTLVRHLVRHVAEKSDLKVGKVLIDVLDTPVSPELLPPDENGEIAQKTEETVGPYELNDFFLYHFFRYGFGRDKLSFLAELAFEGKYSVLDINRCLDQFLRRFFRSQFKRSCMPDGPKVGSVSLSPRGDWRMPSDADCTEWLR